nr:MAG TPA: hypothetical protein [Caudoviricetes sp.]
MLAQNRHELPVRLDFSKVDQLVRLLDKLLTDQCPNFPVRKAVILTMLVGVEVLLKIVFCFQPYGSVPQLPCP